MNRKQSQPHKQAGQKKKIKLKSILFFQRKEEDHKSNKSSDGKKQQNDDHKYVTNVFVLGNQKLFWHFPNMCNDIPKQLQQAQKCQSISLKKINIPTENGSAQLRIINIQKSLTPVDVLSNILHIQYKNKICVIAYDISNEATQLINSCAQLWKSTQSNKKYQNCMIIAGVNHGTGIVKMKSKKGMELAKKYGAVFLQIQENQYNGIIEKIQLVSKSVSSTEAQLLARLKNVQMQISTLKSKLHFLKFSSLSQVYQIWNCKVDGLIELVRQILDVFLEFTGFIQKISQRLFSVQYLQKLKNKLKQYYVLKKFIDDKDLKSSVANQQTNSQDNNKSITIKNQQYTNKKQKIQRLIYLANQQINKIQSLGNRNQNIQLRFQQIMDRINQKIKLFQQEFESITQLKQKLSQLSNFNENNKNNQQNIRNNRTDQRQQQFLNKFLSKMAIQIKSIGSFRQTINYNKQQCLNFHNLMLNKDKVQTNSNQEQQQNAMNMLIKYFLDAKKITNRKQPTQQKTSNNISKTQIQQFKQQIFDSTQQIRNIINQYDSKNAEDKEYNQDYLKQRLQIQEHIYQVIMENHRRYPKNDPYDKIPEMIKKQSKSGIK